jgi:4'-phosphopantetheinyl transferase
MIRPMNKTSAVSSVFMPPQLGEHQAHVWHVDLQNHSADLTLWESTLSEDEHQCASRFRFPRDRNRYSATRALLRILLAAYLDSDPEALRFRYTEHGKPALGGVHENSRLMFNVSHSDGVALFGVTLGRDIGVDVERVRHDFEVLTIAKRFFSVAEQRAFDAVPPAQQHRAFFDCWTRKEAYVKALGEGLSHPLDQFDVSFSPGERPRLIATRPDHEEATTWTMASPELGAGYAAAVIAKSSTLAIDCWELPNLEELTRTLQDTH